MRHDGTHIVKLGGSLLDLPDLPQRLAAYREAEMGQQTLLVIGGGATANAVRQFDQQFSIGEHASHWLAVRRCSSMRICSQAQLPDVCLVCDDTQCDRAWQAGQLAIMSPLSWLEREDRQSIHIPHCWQFTSDSIAAHVACQLGAKRLTLLKSTLPEDDKTTLKQAADDGLVDERFPATAQAVPCIELVNLRAGDRPRCVLHHSL